MPALTNTKHERFVQALIKGETLRQSYILAGYKDNEKNAARLKKSEGVAARLAELQEKVADKAVLTASDLIAQLDEDRLFAREQENPSAAVSATMGKAKVAGLLTDKHEHTGKGGGPVLHEEVIARDVIASRLSRLADASRATEDTCEPE